MVKPTPPPGTAPAPRTPARTGPMPVKVAGAPTSARGSAPASRPPSVRPPAAKPVVTPKEEARPPLSRRTLNVDLVPGAGAPGPAPSPMSEALGKVAAKPAPAAEPEPPTLVKSAPPEPPPIDEAPLSDILGDLDQSFDALLSEPGKVQQGGPGEAIGEAQTLFKQIAVAYIAPVRAFVLELRSGEASKDWVGVCAPAVSSMVSSATQMGLAALAAALSELKLALDAAESAPGATVRGEPRQRVLAMAEALMAELPDAFDIDQEAERRDHVIVGSLLAQVPGVRKVQLEKIYRAGITSLSMFLLASARELAETTGLEYDLCERIVARFARFKQESLATPADTSHKAELARLGELAKELGRLNDQYERDKRRVRQARSELVNEVNVLLARVGHLEMVEQLERLPFQKKQEELERFVEQKQKVVG